MTFFEYLCHATALQTHTDKWTYLGGDVMALRALLTIATCLALSPASSRAAPIMVAGFTFANGEVDFADDAFVTSGSVTGANAQTVHDTLVGSNTEDSIRVITPDVAEIEIVFSDNLILNGPGTDLVVFERSGSAPPNNNGPPPGGSDPNERFGFSVHDGISFSAFVDVDPVNTGFVSPGDPSLSIYVVEIDLSDFGLGIGETTNRVRIRLVDNLVSRSADPTAVGALNSLAVPEPSETILLVAALCVAARRRSTRL